MNNEYREEQRKMLHSLFYQAEKAQSPSLFLYSYGVRVLKHDERIVKRLTDEQRDDLRRHFKFAVDEECLLIIIDAVQRELGVID